MINFSTISEAIKLAQKASILEISTPKPGNINSNRKEDMQFFADFTKGLVAIIDAFSHYFLQNKTASSIGTLIKSAAYKMIDAQKHGNVLLGHILLYAPLLCAVNEKLQKGSSINISWDEFWAEVEFIIQNANEEDGALLAEAILYARPGGLKNPGGVPFTTKYDFTDPNSPNKIRDDKIALKNLFQESAHFDLISREYIQTYSFSRKIIETWLIPNLKCFSTQEALVLALYIYILSIEPDSLILRKNTPGIAKKIQEMAQELTRNGNISNQRNLFSQADRIQNLDNYLRQAGGKLNPGTTADLTACVLFIGFLFQIIN